jgi:formamidopyrimidine-DNA glycosylase
MPELPDVVVYVERLIALLGGRTLDQIHLISPFVLRTVDPPVTAAHGRTLVGTRRVGKRVVLELEGALFVVFHLMIAGRLRLRPASAKLNRSQCLAVLRFGDDAVWLTEASTKKRAALYIVLGEDALAAMDRGGLDVLAADLASFAAAIRRERHTLKWTLTNPETFDGIGNAYSDEMLHLAKLSPVLRTDRITDGEIKRLFDAARDTLRTWIERTRDEVGEGFPEKVTAFRTGMRVHGRFRQSCPVCGAPVQRVVRADSEMNYCAVCQTGGRPLSDRVLAPLFGKSWKGWGLKDDG